MSSPPEAKVLERRPKAVSFLIEELVQQVLDGRLRVPKFQRDLRWDESDVEKLLDSIYRGYPIGTLLFWVRRGDAQKIEYGTVSVDAPAMSEAWWVVDGQQRLNALVRALAGAGSPTERFALYFDLEAERFVRPKPRVEIPQQWLPLTVVVDSERLMDWILEHPGVNRSLAITVGRRIREYSVPVHLVTTEDEGAVREIFARLNDTGKRMLPNEVFSARYGAGSDAPPSDVHDIAKRLSEFGFGDLEPELLHSMMLATRGIEMANDRVPRLDGHPAQIALSDLERTARSVVQFFRETAKIPHIALLPYELPLISLARFFHLFPEAHPRNRELLSRWVWRGAISGQHQGDATASLNAINATNEHDSVQRLLEMVDPGAALANPLPHADLDGFRFRDARGKLLTLALHSLAPRHLETNELLDIAKDASVLLPPARITSGLPDGVLANRIIHSSNGAPCLERLIEANARTEALASHGLDADMVTALRERDLEAFRQLREHRLAAVVRDLYELRSQPHQSDRPPISALVIDDDDELEGSSDGLSG